jgi:HEAT repeat protein
LIDLLERETHRRRVEAAEALGRLGEIAAPTIPALSSQLAGPGVEVAVRAIEALGRIGRCSAPALIAAIDRIEKADESILCWLAKALGETKEREAIPCLQGYLSHPDPEVRYFVSGALAKLSLS